MQCSFDSTLAFICDVLCCQGKDEMLGRCSCVPVVTLKSSMDCVSVKLQWECVMKKSVSAGEVLVAAELFLKVPLSLHHHTP